MNKTVKCILGGLSSGLILIVISSLIHGLVFGRLWESVSYMRPTDSWPFMPGAPLLTLCWCTLLSFSFGKIHQFMPGANLLRKGFNYGIYIFVIFVPFVEIWTYLQYDLPFMAIIAGMLVYLIALPLGMLSAAAILKAHVEKAEVSTEKVIG